MAGSDTWWCYYGRLEHLEERRYLPFLASSSCPPPPYSSFLPISLFEPYFQRPSLLNCHCPRTPSFLHFYHLYLTFPFNPPTTTHFPLFEHPFRKLSTQPQTTAVSTVLMPPLQAGTCTLDSAACLEMRWE